MANELFIQPGSGLSFPWAEYVGPSGSTSRKRLATSSGLITMMMDIFWEDEDRATREILGWAYKNPNLIEAPTGLSRVPPMKHPYYFWMRATNIESEGVQWIDKVTFTGAGPISEYTLQRLSITFSALPYDILNDNAKELVEFVGAESKRYVFQTEKPTVTFANYGNPSSYQFANLTNVPARLVADPIVPGSQRNIKIAYKNINYKWMYVPYNFLYNSNGNAPKLDAAIGRVNTTTFFGKPPGTMLFEAIDYEPVVLPVNPVMMGYFDYQPPRAVTVSLSYKFFDPPFNSAVDHTTFDKRGHNLAPDIGGFLLDADSNREIGWYPVILEGGAPVYGGYDMNKIFTAHDA